MTDVDRRAFVQAIARLKVALREPEADAVELKVYYTALKDLEIEFVVAAAEELMGHARWFPKTSELRAAAATVEAKRIEAQRALLRKLPAPLCVGCADTGWQHDANGRVHRCGCLTLRRLELLGRRPWPIVPAIGPGCPTETDETIGPAEARSLTSTIERKTGRLIGPRAMPESWESRQARQHDEEERTSNG